MGSRDHHRRGEAEEVIEPDDDEGSLVVPVVLAMGILFVLFGAVVGFT